MSKLRSPLLLALALSACALDTRPLVGTPPASCSSGTACVGVSARECDAGGCKARDAAPSGSVSVPVTRVDAATSVSMTDVGAPDAAVIADAGLDAGSARVAAAGSGAAVTRQGAGGSVAPTVNAQAGAMAQGGVGFPGRGPRAGVAGSGARTSVAGAGARAGGFGGASGLGFGKGASGRSGSTAAGSGGVGMPAVPAGGPCRADSDCALGEECEDGLCETHSGRGKGRGPG
jgi:hypothetical protein